MNWLSWNRTGYSGTTHISGRRLIDYDPVNWWYGFEAVPLALIGIWLMITKNNYPWEMLMEDVEEEE